MAIRAPSRDDPSNTWHCENGLNVKEALELYDDVKNNVKRQTIY